MKTIKLLLLCCTISSTVFCQHQPVKMDLKKKVVKLDSTGSANEVESKYGMPVDQILKNGPILQKDGYYWNYASFNNICYRITNKDNTECEVYGGLNFGGLSQFDGPREIESFIIHSNCSVEVAALFVNEKNAADYRYHIVENDYKELVSWTKPSVFKYTADGKLKYAYLGKFDYVKGQQIKVEIYYVKNYGRQDALLIDECDTQPARIGAQVFYSSTGKYPNRAAYLWNNYIVPVKDDKKRPPRYHDNFIESTSASDIKIRLGDSLRFMDFANYSFGVQQTYLYKVVLKREIDGQIDSVDLGQTRGTVTLYKELWKYPGKYTVTYTPQLNKLIKRSEANYFYYTFSKSFCLYNLSTSYKFTVLPDLNTVNTIPVKTVVLIIVILLTTVSFMFVTYRSRQKRKLAKEAQNKQIATLQLQSVRSQLNPHFIFNALAGIQNLMNKNAVEDANRYLTRFARLTRNVLDDGQKELTTIEHEAALLNDYMQMEQLRFSFKFNINTNDVDPQIEIPAMLLQPFVENAVKHGVSALKEQGMITIDIAKHENNVTLSVADNGKGFSDDKTAGMGIKLCEERIRLLNSIYKNANIVFHKKSDSNGTQINIELNNWLQ